MLTEIALLNKLRHVFAHELLCWEMWEQGRQAAPVGVAFIFYLFDFRIVKLIVGSLFVLFAALEASCRFCIACKIYPLIYGM